MITWSLSYRDISRSLRSDCNTEATEASEMGEWCTIRIENSRYLLVIELSDFLSSDRFLTIFLTTVLLLQQCCPSCAVLFVLPSLCYLPCALLLVLSSSCCLHAILLVPSSSCYHPPSRD